MLAIKTKTPDGKTYRMFLERDESEDNTNAYELVGYVQDGFGYMWDGYPIHLGRVLLPFKKSVEDLEEGDRISVREPKGRIGSFHDMAYLKTISIDVESSVTS